MAQSNGYGYVTVTKPDTLSCQQAKLLLCMAEHRFKTKYALAAEKLAAEPEVTETNRAMERGNRLEPVILQWVADEIGEQIVHT
jgi:hypothetical protein